MFFALRIAEKEPFVLLKQAAKNAINSSLNSSLGKEEYEHMMTVEYCNGHINQ